MEFAGAAEAAVADTEPKNVHATRLLAWCDRNRRWIFAAILVLYAAGFTGRWRINPDSAIYMSLGRSLAEGAGYVYNGEHHTRYEPGLPLVIAASYRIFGPDRYAPILLFILACSLTSLFLAYRLMLRHAGRPTAVIVVAGFAICESFVRYGFQVVTDTPFLVGVLLYLLAYERLVAPHVSNGGRDKLRWVSWIVIPLATFAMTAIRPASLSFVGAVGLACAWHLFRGPNRKRHIVIGILTLAAFLSFRYVDPRRATAGAEVKREQRLKSLLTEQREFFTAHVAENVKDFLETVAPRAVFATDFAPVVDTAVTVSIMAAGISLFRKRVLWGAWCLATFAQCMFWLPKERYLVAILPLVVYGLWRGVVWLSSRPRLSRVASLVVFVAPIAVFIGANLGRDAYFLNQQRHAGADRNGSRDAEETATIVMANAIADAAREDGAVIFAAQFDELSYFSRKRVEGTPWSGRWPPTRKELADFFERAKSIPAKYVVLPDEKGKPYIKDMIDRFGMTTSEAITTVERPRDRKGNSVPPFTLHKLIPATPTSSDALKVR